MKKTILLIFALQFILLAFDGKHEGFVLGVNAGAQGFGYSELDKFNRVSYHDKHADISPLVGLLLGYGNSKVLFLTNLGVTSFTSVKVKLNPDKSESSEFTSKTIPTASLGIRFYTASQRVFKPQFYYGFEFGQMFHMEDDVYQGQGILVGVTTGFEFIQHLSTELKVIGGGASEYERYFSYLAIQGLLVFTLF